MPYASCEYIRLRSYAGCAYTSPQIAPCMQHVVTWAGYPTPERAMNQNDTYTNLAVKQKRIICQIRQHNLLETVTNLNDNHAVSAVSRLVQDKDRQISIRLSTIGVTSNVNMLPTTAATLLKSF